MESELPKGYTSFSNKRSLWENSTVMGVIVDFLPARPTRGPDWQISFDIQDDLYVKHRVKFFGRQEELPAVKSNGDVIIVRNIKLSTYQGTENLLSNRSTTWTIFYESDIPEDMPGGRLAIPFISSKRGKASAPTSEETKYALQLCNSINRKDHKAISEAQLTVSSSRPSKHKFDLIENIQPDTFYTFICQVVKVYDGSFNLMVYVTDFTNNKNLYNYTEANGPSTDGWRGPLGQFTLAVTVFDPHASWFRQNIKLNDYIELRHVHIRFGRTEGAHRLEGIIHQDKSYSARIDISKAALDEDNRDERMTDFLLRKRSYVEHCGDWTKSKKRQADQTNGPQSKSSLKRARQKKSKQMEEGGMVQHRGEATEKLVDDDGIPIPRREKRLADSKLNGNVVCNHDSNPVRPLSYFLQRDELHTIVTPSGNELIQPWQNRRRRADVRVVDFFPPDLKDFAVRDKVSEFDGLDDDKEEDSTVRPSNCDDNDGNVSDASSDCSKPEDDPDANMETQDWNDAISRGYKYVWRFALLVQDRFTPRGTEPARMVLNVSGDEAIFLLDGLKPCDLHKKKNRRQLERLRVKLFILWGDLEERKRAASSGTKGEILPRMLNEKELAEKPVSLPFSCCIQEYGVRLAGQVPIFERRFSIFETKIK